MLPLMGIYGVAIAVTAVATDILILAEIATNCYKEYKENQKLKKEKKTSSCQKEDTKKKLIN